MTYVADPRRWVEQTFAEAQLGDPRRTQRLIHSATKIARHPEKSFPQLFNWNELRGWYRLCDQDMATLDAVQLPHRRQTLEAMQRPEPVLILHDTTFLDYTLHKKLQGKAPFGQGQGEGLLQHNSLAVLPQSRQLLGLPFQQLTTRKLAPKNETRTQKRKRVRESQLWQDGFEGVGTTPENCCWVNVCDRGADDYWAFRKSESLGQDFLIRACQNRTVFLDAAKKSSRGLLDRARSLVSKGIDKVDIPGRGGKHPRQARTAVVHLAAAPIWIPAPWDTPKRQDQPTVAAWVIRVWEPQPPQGETPLEWVLICSLPTETLEELLERRDWYSCRWIVETFHDIEKNGCSEELRRFRTAERMAPCLGVLSVVAVRVYQLRNALETSPDSPAEEVATQGEREVIGRLLKKPAELLTIKTFVHGVAKLGGFLGRKGDKDPGLRTLWRGYQRLQDMVEGFQLRDSPPTAPV